MSVESVPDELTIWVNRFGRPCDSERHDAVPLDVVPASAFREARARAEALAEALETAQGEAYLGALIGDDTPDPLKACLSVIDACMPALRAFRESRSVNELEQ